MSAHIGLREERRAGRVLARRIGRLFMQRPVQVGIKPKAESPASPDVG